MAKKQTAESKQPTVKATVSVNDLRTQTLAELNKTLKSVKADLAEARKSHAAGELVNPQVLALFKKTIARVQTLMVEKARETERKED